MFQNYSGEGQTALGTCQGTLRKELPAREQKGGSVASGKDGVSHFGGFTFACKYEVWPLGGDGL